MSVDAWATFFILLLFLKLLEQRLERRPKRHTKEEDHW